MLAKVQICVNLLFITLVIKIVEVLRTWREYGRTLGTERPIRLNDTGGTGAPGTDSDFDDVFALRVLQRVAEFSRVDGGIPELDGFVVQPGLAEAGVAQGLAEGLLHAPVQRGWLTTRPGQLQTTCDLIGGYEAVREDPRSPHSNVVGAGRFLTCRVASGPAGARWTSCSFSTR